MNGRAGLEVNRMQNWYEGEKTNYKEQGNTYKGKSLEVQTEQ